MNKILICFGTRPEYIKVKSLIENLENILVCYIGQHIDITEEIKYDFKIDIDHDISKNRLNNIICNIMKNTEIFLNVEYVLVQGDTTSACGMALSAFNNKKKVIHLEAGLRSYNIENPYPEEMNRQIISRIASIHLCPTELNRNNLLKEKVMGEIFVTGNTGLDNIDKSNCSYENKVLVTLHRRENHDIIEEWFNEIEDVALKYNEIEFIIPLHHNPEIQKHKYIFNKVKMCNPLTHEELINYIKKCKFVISDSGGLQEECSFLNKKIIICRKTTEREEILETNGYLCKEPDMLEKYVNKVINNYECNNKCPYGNGNSWKNIKEILTNL
jgi:UDP-N-acetylglucosamine 2-epimerase (non-hydrolysing)